MLESCLEILDWADALGPVDSIAHSQGTLVALALRCPTRVRRIVLTGAVDGGLLATHRARGMPWCWPGMDSHRA